MKKARNALAILSLFSMATLFLGGCKPEPKQPKKDPTKVEVAVKIVQVEFNEDSAYRYVAEQVAFGPRVPGTSAHNKCLMYLRNKLAGFCDSVYINRGDITGQSGKKSLVNNVVGVFNPKSTNRIVLAAHWDTRPQADEDPVNKTTPADGANDGGSGVGVLLEVARQLQILKPNLGIDIIFFDQEDGGDRHGGPDSWCLGSQMWGRWVKENGYMANAGILLDMVGAKNATFAYEGHSIQFNKRLMLDVWKTGQRLGYGAYFINLNGGMITDDHLYMNTMAGVPSIDIIHHDLTTENGFPDHWHRHTDNMDAIDKKTLKAVGHTVLHYTANRQ